MKVSKMTAWQEFRSYCREMFSAAVEACEPKKLVEGFLKNYDISAFDKIYVVGWGKASAGMALGAESVLGRGIHKGMVLSGEDREGQIRIRSVPHPFPTEGTIELTGRVKAIVEAVNEDDLLISLVSGGGSAMLCDPTLTLGDLNDSISELMNAGAEIAEINAFRRSVSNVKGGRLGSNCRGHILNLVISDVIEGGLWDVASGPTVADESNIAGYDVGKRYGLSENVLASVLDFRPYIEAESYILADNSTAVQAAFECGRTLGLEVFARGESYTGPAQDVGLMLASEAAGREIYISGGESTVNIKGNGTGGRSQHLCLSLHDESVDCFSSGTDGIDGSSNAAGAFMDEGSRAEDWKRFYDSFDSASFFKRSNSQLITGPTGTNVCDLTILRRC